MGNFRAFLYIGFLCWLGTPVWAGSPNQAPVVSAGSAQSIIWPAVVSLSGTATDDGLPNPPAAMTYTWTSAPGNPGLVTFSNPNALNTTASFSIAGIYTLTLTASDGVLSTGSNVVITVNPSTATLYNLTLTAPNGEILLSPYQSNYPAGSQVTMTIVPNTGYAFSSWGGDVSGTSNPLTVTVNGNMNIIANFTAVTMPTTCSSITQWGITWTFDKSYPCGTFVNGDYWVLGPITLTDITPEAGQGTNGWEINPQSHANQPYDARAFSYLASLQPSLPLNVPVNSSIVKAVSGAGPIIGHQTDLKTAAVLTVLGSIPPDNGATVFRPPYFGATKPLYSANDLQPQILPSLIPPPGAPALNWVSQTFQRVQLDHQENWVGRAIHPLEDMPDYGADVATNMALATLRMELNDPASAKKSAMINFVQNGIDLYQDVLTGQSFPANGGHDLGRKLTIMFAGIMLNNQGMLNAVTNASHSTFQEDGQLTYFPQGNNGQGITVWGQSIPESQYWYELENPPDTGSKVGLDPYGYIDGGEVPGTTYQLLTALVFKDEAIAARLLPNGVAIFNDNHFFDYVDRWVNVGTWTMPDPCAPFDGIPSNYGITFGPDGHGSCIKGSGRFPNLQGTNKDSGGYGYSTFANGMWSAYRITPVPPVITISANPATISGGSSSTLQWSVTGALNCTGSGGIWSGPVPVSGIKATGNITANTTYTLSCSGYGGSSSQSVTVAVSGTNQQSSLDTGMIGHWSLDSQDTIGASTVDSSGYGNNGTIAGTVTTVAGKINQALSFDGVSNYVNFPPDNFGLTSAVTVSAWVKPSAIADSTILTRGRVFGANVAQQVYNLALTSGGAFRFQVSDGNTAKTVYSPGISAGQWYHVVGIFDGTNISLYVNGALQQTIPTGYSSLNPAPAYGKTATGIGADVNDINDYPCFFTGLMDDVRIYDRALTANEIQMLYNWHGNAVPTVNLTSDHASYTAPASMVLTALASEVNGSIANVAFNSSSCPNNVCGTATSSPYTLTLNNIPLGTYTFTATATDGNGATAASAPVTVTVNAPPATTYTLNITASNGSVAQTVNGTASNGPYNAGTAVTLTATPANDYQFSSWSSTSGDVSGTGNPVTVAMNANENVTANFTPVVQPLTVAVSKDQTVTMPLTANLSASLSLNGTLNPTGATQAWHLISGPAAVYFAGNDPAQLGTTVSFSKPGTYVFNLTAAVGSAQATSSNVTVTVNAAPVFALTVNQASNGTAAARVDGVLQNGNQNNLNWLTQAVLTAVPAPGYQFSSWSGDVISTVNPLVVTMDNNKNITPHFTAVTPVSTVACPNASSAGVICPGLGFNGVTPQPAGIGSTRGFDETAIARWDVVPYQTFSNTFNVGVVAFHMNGIDHVAFSANGGPWTNVTRMTMNPQTNTVEYWAVLRASDFTDGPVELRAIVYPTVGIPRVLQGAAFQYNGQYSIILYANADNKLPAGTLWVSPSGSDTNGNGSQDNPYATILKAAQSATDGTTIYLQAGTYNFAAASNVVMNNRWITISAAPGVERNSVIINPLANAIGIKHLAYQNVTINETGGWEITGNSYQGAYSGAVWIDSTDITSSLGRNVPEIWYPVYPGSWAEKYITNSTIHDFPSRAIAGIDLVRGVAINKIGDDAIDNPELVVNTSINDVTGDNVGDHVDTIQYFPAQVDANSIVYGVKASRVNGQLLFGSILSPSEGGPPGGVMTNIAVVNYEATQQYTYASSPQAEQLSGEHMLLYNLTLPAAPLLLLDTVPQTGAGANKNIKIADSILYSLFADDPNNEILERVHIINPSFGSVPSFGTITTGNPGFASGLVPDPSSTASDAASGMFTNTGDFHLAPNSPVIGLVPTPYVPVDLDGNARPSPDSQGAYFYNSQTALILTDVNSGVAPLTVHFDGSHSGGDNPITGYLWNFGDGTTSNQATVAHIFNNPGNYTVTLTVTYSDGSQAAATKTIAVNPPPVQGLIFGLTFDNTITDYSANQLPARWVGPPSYGAGMFNQAIALNGTSTGSYIDVPYNTALDGMANMSIAFWARKNSSGIGGTVLDHHLGYWVQVINNALTGYFFSASGTRTNYSFPAPNDANWHHYALVYNGSTLTAYVDGLPSGNPVPMTGNIDVDSSDELYIGLYPYNPILSFAGSMDELKIYNIALTSAQIAALAAPPEVNQAPVITTQPLSQTTYVGHMATFSVTCTGASPMNYQWQKNGADITGATGASYTTNLLTLLDNGSSYRVVVSNAAGSVTSSAAKLTVGIQPFIKNRPTPNPVQLNPNAVTASMLKLSRPLTSSAVAAPVTVTVNKPSAFTDSIDILDNLDDEDAGTDKRSTGSFSPHSQ